MIKFPRSLSVWKPLPIHSLEDVCDTVDFVHIDSGTVNSGMEREEENELHLQQAITYHSSIPIPEISNLPDIQFYNSLYPDDYVMPKQLIHVEPIMYDQEFPDYDIDEQDENFIETEGKKYNLTPYLFEEMIDFMEKSSGRIVISFKEAEILIKEDSELVSLVYNYWLDKRLSTKSPLILSVKKDKGTSTNDPYLCFRSITSRVHTRRHKKSDEISYQNMLKLKQDLMRAVELFEMVKRREKLKRDLIEVYLKIYESRYNSEDFSGHIISSVAKYNQISVLSLLNTNFTTRHIRKRPIPEVSSSEDIYDDESSSEGMFAFKRKPGCVYLAPISFWNEEPEVPCKKVCVSRRFGRGGRMIIDRVSCDFNETFYKNGEKCFFRGM